MKALINGRSKVYSQFLSDHAVKNANIAEAYNELVKFDAAVAQAVQDHFAALKRLVKVAEKVREGCMATIEMALKGEVFDCALRASVLILQRRTRALKCSSGLFKAATTRRNDERRLLDRRNEVGLEFQTEIDETKRSGHEGHSELYGSYGPGAHENEHA